MDLFSGPPILSLVGFDQWGPWQNTGRGRRRRSTYLSSFLLSVWGHLGLRPWMENHYSLHDNLLYMTFFLQVLPTPPPPSLLLPRVGNSGSVPNPDYCPKFLVVLLYPEYTFVKVP